jgi:thiosulfate dehydrogenase [quinone] large subunit
MNVSVNVPTRPGDVGKQSLSPSNSTSSKVKPSEYVMSAMAILPMRLFLGITFLYAALQKLTDPGFFNSNSTTFIGRQIFSFSQGSPIHSILQLAGHFPVAAGILTIVAEGSIGLLVLLGLFTRPAALMGLFLSLVFFLSASWHTYPYFMGSDIVFVVCWVTLLLAGPGPFSVD